MIYNDDKENFQCWQAKDDCNKVFVQIGATVTSDECLKITQEKILSQKYKSLKS